MWRAPLEHTGTAVLCLGLLLTHLVGEARYFVSGDEDMEPEEHGSSPVSVLFYADDNKWFFTQEDKQIIGIGAVVQVLCQPGQQVALQCSYHYEQHTHISQLSVQWRSPNNELLCHYIKHKAYQNCTRGYTIAYRPGSITLTIRRVSMDDFGLHVCSVSKRDEFSDSSVELVRKPESVTSAPKSGGNQSGPTWMLTLLHTSWSVCVWRRIQ